MKNNFSLTLRFSNSIDTSLVIFGTSAEVMKWQLWEEILANLDGERWLLEKSNSYQRKVDSLGRLSVCTGFNCIAQIMLFAMNLS